MPGSRGATLVTVSGAVSYPGVLEVPVGVELGEVARAVGARPSQAVVIGGYHGTWLTPTRRCPCPSMGSPPRDEPSAPAS